METAIIPLGYNLDKVLEKLSSVNKERKIKRKDMENIFDDIVKGEDGMYMPIKDLIIIWDYLTQKVIFIC